MHATLERLTPEEDALMRRLHSLVRLGARLAPSRRELLDEIRYRDRRAEVREPEPHTVATPVWVS